MDKLLVVMKKKQKNKKNHTHTSENTYHTCIYSLNSVTLNKNANGIPQTTEAANYFSKVQIYIAVTETECTGMKKKKKQICLSTTISR